MSIGNLIVRVLQFYGVLLVAYVILSWVVRATPGGILYDLYRVLASLCEPYIGIFRRILPAAVTGAAGLDFAPLIAYLVLQVIATLVPRGF